MNADLPDHPPTEIVVNAESAWSPEVPTSRWKPIAWGNQWPTWGQREWPGAIHQQKIIETHENVSI